MLSQIFICVAALIHVYIFAMESLLWGRPKTNKTFGMTSEQAEHNRLFAFNQGYYNLFLSLAIFLGLGFSANGYVVVGMTLMIYAATSMLGASLVLLFSQRRMVRAALIQGVPPFLGLVFLLINHEAPIS